MPHVSLQITRGATREQKAALVRAFTYALVRVLGKKPEDAHIVIHEIDEENWGHAGMLADEWRGARPAQPAAPATQVVRTVMPVPINQRRPQPPLS